MKPIEIHNSTIPCCLPVQESRSTEVNVYNPACLDPVLEASRNTSAITPTITKHKVPRIDLARYTISRILTSASHFLGFSWRSMSRRIGMAASELAQTSCRCSLDGLVVGVLQPLPSCAVMVRGVQGPRKRLSCCYLADSLDISC